MEPGDHGLRYVTLWAKITFPLLNCLPQVFCHNDGKLTNIETSPLSKPDSQLYCSRKAGEQNHKPRQKGNLGWGERHATSLAVTEGQYGGQGSAMSIHLPGDSQ